MSLFNYNILIIFLLFFLYFGNDAEDEELAFGSSHLSHQWKSDFLSSTDPRVFVVLAASFDSPTSISNYGILTPLTSFIWHRVFNVTPIVILGTQEAGRVSTIIESAFASLFRQAGGRIHCISKSTSRDDGVGVSLDPELVGESLITTLQVSRLASIALHYMKENDVIFTSDADIWPMSNLFWSRLILLSQKNDFHVYNGPFFHSQCERKDCNFLALTSLAAKTHIWREILSKWLDSLQYAPSPRTEFCKYSNTTVPNPILPWYIDSKYRKFNESILNSRNQLHISFPDLLRTFLYQGSKVYGSVWDREARLKYFDNSYKQNHIWNYDQVLAAEMFLASQPSVAINDDVRRLDKFGPVGTESQFFAAVLGKSVEDFTDAHLDGVEDGNWWRLEEIWHLIFKEKSSPLQSAAYEFFEEVRVFSDLIKANIDSPLVIDDNAKNFVGLCDEV